MMIIDEIKKIIYVAVPKTASTTIHIAFNIYEHPEPKNTICLYHKYYL